MSTLRPTDSPLFVYPLRHVTEAAARAAYAWIGRGRKEDGDGAAVAAMIAEIHAAGARVALYPAGDVAGAIMAVSGSAAHDRLQMLMVVGRTGERQVLTSYDPNARPDRPSVFA